MRRTFWLLFSAAVALLLASGTGLALPSEKPDDTPMIDGRVRAIEQVGTNIWLGGRFSRVEQRNDTLLGSVANVAVFDSKTEKYTKGVAPRLGGADSEIFDMTLYGEDVLIAGNFPGPTGKEGNLVLVDGDSGKVIRWYDDSPKLKSVLAVRKSRGWAKRSASPREEETGRAAGTFRDPGRGLKKPRPFLSA